MIDDTPYKIKDANNIILVNDRTIAYTGKLNNRIVICIADLITGKCYIAYSIGSEYKFSNMSII